MELRFENVSGRKKKLLIKNVSFTVENGYITGLIGHNGAGKTTLFRYVMDINEKYEGDILVNGKNIRSNHSMFRNQIAYISDEPRFFQKKTAMENAKLCRGLYDDFSMEIFVETMKNIQLPVSRELQNMSRGEYLKFQMAFAMAHGTKLYLLDEVTAGMDPVFRKDFFRILKQLLAEEDVAILMSTHIEEEIVRHMDYLAKLNQGELVSFHMVGECFSENSENVNWENDEQ